MREPCQPPPVKNMGLGKVQVGRAWGSSQHWERRGFGERSPAALDTKGCLSELLRALVLRRRDGLILARGA